MDKVTIQRCCHLGEHIYNKAECPLYEVYNMAAYYGNSSFDDSARYRVCCDAFLLSKIFKI